MEVLACQVIEPERARQTRPLVCEIGAQTFSFVTNPKSP